MPDNPTLIFVYGTLKRGFPNHHLLQDLLDGGDATVLGPHLTRHPYPLVLGPHGVPFLLNLPNSGRRVKGELYSVSARGLAPLDAFEGIAIGNYERLSLQVVGENEESAVEAEAYFAHRSYGEAMWVRSGRICLDEYSETLAKEYVRIQERVGPGSLLDDIRAFVFSSGN